MKILFPGLLAISIFSFSFLALAADMASSNGEKANVVKVISADLVIDPAARQDPASKSISIPVTFKNKCYKDIYVAAHYKDMDGTWLTIGWWEISAYSNSLIFHTKNRVFYYTAKSTDGTIKWEGTDSFWRVRGSEDAYGFYKVSGPSTFVPYTHSLTCN